MGWYDAYKGNSSRVDVNLNKNGDLVNAFSGAFTDFGKALVEDERYQDSKATTELNNKLTNLQISNAQTKADNLGEVAEQKKIDDAYLSSAYSRPNVQSFDANRDKSLKPSPEAIKSAESHFDKKTKELEDADKWVQKEFNSDLSKAYATGGYKSFEELKKSNPELIDFADGSTVASIKKAFDDTSTEVSALEQAKKNLINQAKLLKKDKEIIKLQKEKTNKGFKYSETAGAKITSLVKSALGMDNELVDFTDAKQQEFNSMVTEISTLSKELSLEPNLAYKAYLMKRDKEKVENDDPLGLLK